MHQMLNNTGRIIEMLAKSEVNEISPRFLIGKNLSAFGNTNEYDKLMSDV